MINLVIFDLDDTLYPEADFTRSGFKTVAKEFSAEIGLDEKQLMQQLDRLNSTSSNYVFNRFLEQLSLPQKPYLDKMISLFRKHIPEIRLDEDANQLIKILRNKSLHLGLISDGYLETQTNKVKALQLDTLLDKIVLTDYWGREFWKPHPRAFEEMLSHFKVCPEAAVYIGDNPLKDFIAPRKLGMYSVQLLRANGVYKNCKAPAEGEPDYRVNSLAELSSLITEVMI